jgi:hypothetical protein
LLVDGYHIVVERDAPAFATALERVARFREVHENMSHGEGRNGEEVTSIPPLGRRVIGKLEVRLVDERRGRERGVTTARSKPSVRDRSELVVGERDESVQRALSCFRGTPR